MKMNKRGLSGIVTIVLIILLVLVAIGIIWAAIRPPIQETGDRLSGDCLTLNVEALSCTRSTNDNGWDVTFRRNAGSGNSLADIKLVLATDAGESAVVNYGALLTELESRSFSILDTNGGLATADNVNVAAVIQPGETPITCEPVNDPVDCA